MKLLTKKEILNDKQRYFKLKYIKYKSKYLNLKSQVGGIYKTSILDNLYHQSQFPIQIQANEYKTSILDNYINAQFPIQIQANKYKNKLRDYYENYKIIGIQTITPKATIIGDTQDINLISLFSKIAPTEISKLIIKSYEPNTTIILLSQGDKKIDEKANLETGVAETIQQVGNILMNNHFKVYIVGITDKPIEKLKLIFKNRDIQISDTYIVNDDLINESVLRYYYTNIDNWFNSDKKPKIKYAKDQLFSNLISDVTFLVHPYPNQKLKNTSLSSHVFGNYIEIVPLSLK